MSGRPLPPSGAPPLLTIRDVAARLQCHKRTVHDYIATGRLPSLVIGGGLRRIRPEDLERFIEAGRMPRGAGDAP